MRRYITSLNAAKQAADRYAREALMPEEQSFPSPATRPPSWPPASTSPWSTVDARLVDLAARLIDA